MPMPNDPAVDGSVEAVAERIAAARAAGRLSKPEGPPPEGMVDADQDDYSPSQNLHTDDELPENDSGIDAEQLRKVALGEDDEPDQDDQGELVDDDEPELEASADEDEPTDAEVADGDQGVELAFESVDELADLLDLEVDDLLGRVKISTLIDGEPGEITLADLRKGHQLESSFTRKNQAFIERQKAWESESEKQRTQLADHFAKATAVLNSAQQQLYADFNSIDWNSLQQTNPQEWTAKRQQLGERQARLNKVMQDTTQQLEAAAAEQKKQEEEAHESHLENQHALLMNAVPAWRKNENLRVKEGSQIAEYLVTEMGFSVDEINNLEDHRLILLGRAALGLNGPSKRKLALAKKKVDKVANLVKPGNADQRRKQGSQATLKRAQDARAKLKKSGSTEDAAAALLARKQHRAASQKRGRRSRI